MYHISIDLDGMMSNRENDIQDLTGKILLATPNISNAYMSKSMVYICEHSDKGAMGVVINKILPNMNLLQIFTKMNFGDIGDVEIRIGGDRDIDKGYILHTNKNISENTIAVRDNIRITTCDNLVNTFAFIMGESERKILCVGCYRWDSQQLENEITSNYWIPIRADEALIFGDSCADKWSKAFLKIGLRFPLFLDKFGRA